MISEKSFLSGYLHHDRDLHTKFHVSSSSSFGPAMIVSQSVSQYLLLYIYITSWLPVLRYGESVFTKEIQGTEFFVVVALLFKFWSSSILCIYEHLPATSSASNACFQKKTKTLCRMRGIPSNTRQVIKPMDYN